MMRIYTFTLLFRIDDSRKDECIERLGAAGCTDALVLSGRLGHLALNFCRESGSMKEACESAIADILKAVPDAELYVWNGEGQKIVVDGSGEPDYDF